MINEEVTPRLEEWNYFYHRQVRRFVEMCHMTKHQRRIRQNRAKVRTIERVLRKEEGC